MSMKLKNQEKGFTIIEVLIVLAIAGLIILVVFLAVPALQRNSRNTQRKNDVSALAGAYQEAVNNNNGQVPAAGWENNGKISFYASGDINQNLAGTTAVTAAPGTDTNVVYVRNFAKCNGNAVAASGATRRNVIFYYFVETTGAPTAQCQDV